MSNKLVKVAPILTALLLLTMLVAPVFAAGGGHLWFYSQDPGTLNPPDLLPNPADYDPLYWGLDPDDWLSESVVVPIDWEAPCSIWLGCAQFESLGTKLVISINDAAFAAIDTLTVEGETFSADDWITTYAGPLPPHGVLGIGDWYGYVEVVLGDLYSPPGTPYKVEINIDINLKPGADVSEAKMHFDAYGYTEDQKLIFSPYSHDATFVIPEVATIFLTASSMLALGAYAYKRKKQ